MTTIGSYEAKTHLPRLLDEVEAGASYVVTKHGRPVARLVGIRDSRLPAAELAEAFSQFRAGTRLGIDVREARQDGRR